eukprot:Lithocolla_globosa_v1_NODE_539_length_3795_cov_9.791444.p3 type:complete len:247 gc:universal NODE_539_length_3795_cov_9.791444:2887-2147(-)
MAGVRRTGTGGRLVVDDSIGGDLKMLWSTPIMRVNLANHRLQNVEKVDDLTSFNEALSKRVMEEYEKIRNNNNKTTNTEIDDTQMNHAFYACQKQTGFKLFFDQKEFQLLQTFVKVAVESFLNHLNLHDVETLKNKDFEGWATVLQKGARHGTHIHVKSVISGCYYIGVPTPPGDIVFSDPRGYLYPFGGKYAIRPRPGDLVLFPSWLVHEVEPSLSSTPRISFAFNISGEWGDSGDVSVTSKSFL